VPAGPQMKQIGTGEPIEGAAGTIQPPDFYLLREGGDLRWPGPPSKWILS
jgi:hypothetical protein